MVANAVITAQFLFFVCNVIVSRCLTWLAEFVTMLRFYLYSARTRRLEKSALHQPLNDFEESPLPIEQQHSRTAVLA